jgi:DNA-binding NarL/FixJ family response regulator
MTEAAKDLNAQVSAGLQDRRAVEAVLPVAGQKGSRTRRAVSLALSDRETDVLRLLAREATNPAIARQPGQSPKTVKRHVTHIYDRLGVPTRAGSAIYALEDGLLWAGGLRPWMAIQPARPQEARCGSAATGLTSG